MFPESIGTFTIKLVSRRCSLSKLSKAYKAREKTRLAKDYLVKKWRKIIKNEQKWSKKITKRKGELD